MVTTFEYPNLQRYLQMLRITDNVLAAKRPEEWVKWLGLLGAVVTGILHEWYAMLGILAAAAYLNMALAKTRHGVSSGQELSRRAVEDRMPRLVRVQLEKGDLVQRIGRSQAELLERCATHALAVKSTVAQLELLKTSIPNVYTGTRREAKRAADLAFRRALGTMRQSLVSRQEPYEIDVTRLQEMEKVMSSLAEETEAFAKSIIKTDDKDALEPLLERLRTMRESEGALQNEDE